MNIQELHDANMEGFKVLLNDASINRRGITLINAQVELLIEHFSQEDAKDHFQNTVNEIEYGTLVTTLSQEKLKVQYIVQDLQRLAEWCLQNKFRILGNSAIYSGVRGQIIQLISKINTWETWQHLNYSNGEKKVIP
jgi:hypothetical protein